jgi:adenylate cyclase
MAMPRVDCEIFRIRIYCGSLGDGRRGMDACAASETLVFEGWRFDLLAGVLLHHHERGNWMPVPLGARARNILALLLQTPGALVSKDAIMEAVWPGVVVEANNLTVQIATLRRLLDRNDTKNSCIQTVAGRGYRFVRPVVRVDGSQDSSIMRPRLSVIILPIKNLTGNQKERHLADSITEDLTIDLSSRPDLRVIANELARNRGAIVGRKRICGELGVRYLIDGSVRKLGGMLRVNIQVVATDTGEHLWAHHFDQRTKNRCAAQEEIVREICATLYAVLVDAESVRSKRERPSNPDAFDLIIRARSMALNAMSQREHAERIRLYEEALRLDSSSVVAMTELAGELTRLTSIFNLGYEFDRASGLIQSAAAIEPNHLLVMDASAYILYHQDRFDEAIFAYQRLLKHFPNFYTAYNQIGFCLVFTGRAQEAVPLIKLAIEREPRSGFSWSRYENMGFALLMAGKAEESIPWTRHALAANPCNLAFLRAQFNLRLAAAHAQLVELDEAHRRIAEANRIWPYDTVRSHWPRDPSSRMHAAQMECFQSALRLAGHRDHAEEDADFGVPPDAELHRELAGFTPTTVPGATTICTDDLRQLLSDRKPLVIDPLRYSWGRSIPGAIGLKFAGSGGSFADVAQENLRIVMNRLTAGDINKPVVAIGWNSERFDGRNLALRLVALGYTEVYWYRGGREAWELHGLPETELNLQDW